MKKLTPIRLIRLSRNISSKDLAALLNVSRAYISEVEHGKSKISNKSLEEWLPKIGVSLEGYLELENFINEISKKDTQYEEKYALSFIKALSIVYPEFKKSADETLMSKKMIINFLDQEVIKGKKSIFLAGPTPNDVNIKSWREEACKILEKLDFNGIVYVPEYSSFRPSEDYTKQIEWESEAMENASVIAFWIPQDLPSISTTNAQFGYWIRSGNILYGRSDSHKINNQYLDLLYKKELNMEPYDNLEDLLNESVKKLNKNNILVMKKKKRTE